MNTEIPEPAQFKNRKAGLIVFGVFTILAGCVCALFVPLILMAPALAAKSGSPAAPPAASALPALIYGTLAVAFIWLGVGSIMARRWARALLAIGSWSAFICGSLGLIFFAVMMPQLKQTMAAATPPNQPALPDSAQTGVFIVVIGISGFFLVVLPLIWALFYSGRNVKATCEALDSKRRWTDRCPTPVLAASVWLAFSGISALGVSLAYGVVPFFGVLLTGGVGRAAHFFLALVWIYCAWALYRLHRRGWWIVFVGLALFAISGLITFWQHDLTEIYSAMGYSADYVAKIGALGFNHRIMAWSTVAWTVPALGYLLYIRRFFLRGPVETQVSP